MCRFENNDHSQLLFQDYDQFDMANEVDELEKFLKLTTDDATVTSNAEVHLGNGEAAPEGPRAAEDAQNGDSAEGVVGSTTNEDQQPVENGTRESNDAGVSEDGVDSSNAADEWISTDLADFFIVGYSLLFALLYTARLRS